MSANILPLPDESSPTSLMPTQRISTSLSERISTGTGSKTLTISAVVGERPIDRHIDLPWLILTLQKTFANYGHNYVKVGSPQNELAVWLLQLAIEQGWTGKNFRRRVRQWCATGKKYGGKWGPSDVLDAEQPALHNRAWYEAEIQKDRSSGKRIGVYRVGGRTYYAYRAEVAAYRDKDGNVILEEYIPPKQKALPPAPMSEEQKAAIAEMVSATKLQFQVREQQQEIERLREELSKKDRTIEQLAAQGIAPITLSPEMFHPRFLPTARTWRDKNGVLVAVVEEWEFRFYDNGMLKILYPREAEIEIYYSQNIPAQAVAWIIDYTQS